MRKMMLVAQTIILIACVGFFVWRMQDLDRNFQEEMHKLSLMISRYEAKAQFIDEYLQSVQQYTKSEITAKRILAAVYENSLWTRLEPELILSVIRVESEFCPRAQSDAGAIGLMQVMPVTGIYVGRSLGLWIGSDEDLYEIETNIQIGCVFLQECIARLGEENGLGFYYAGRHADYYEEYNDKIAAARSFWEK